jgi:endonuclease/exonuclease/phosphatase family metal-dependent hydrolase
MRSRTFAVSVVTAVALAGCGVEAGVDEQSVASTVAAARVVHPENPGQKKFLTVMSRNVYLGADIFAPFGAPDPLAAAAQVWAEIQASDFGSRADALAAEIVATSPDVVGLQEMYRFVVSLPDGTPVQELDFLALLLESLDELAPGRYRAAAAQPQTELTIPFPALGVEIQMLDRDVILADADVEVLDTSGGSFAARLSAPLTEELTVTVLRGWVAAEIRKERVETTFVNTHLEVREFGPIQGLQALELAQEFALSSPLVLVGDLNSDPRDPPAPLPEPPGGFVPSPYATLASFLDDAWVDAGAGAGFTCCFDADLAPPSQPLSERIDHVLFQADARTMDVERVGLEPVVEFPEGDRWPSDHAGVVATLRFDVRN